MRLERDASADPFLQEACEAGGFGARGLAGGAGGGQRFTRRHERAITCGTGHPCDELGHIIEHTAF